MVLSNNVLKMYKVAEIMFKTLAQRKKIARTTFARHGLYEKRNRHAANAYIM